MFLKSIELFGFKSFADRVRIDFTDGIAVILGPNGCGKSNIVDAIKWVVGEQSTKTLRAGKMEDVIFNGTEKRHPLNVAEVTLHFSNSDGILPMETSEISIKRRLFRTGDSEYYINRSQVRLREIRELFFDTGIGVSAYSIIEQGKIDQILSNRPEDRRLIFEEAAGITKFRMRGVETEKKLARTKDNLRQVDSILGEVSRNYEVLKIQAKKAASYRELRDLVFDCEMKLQLLILAESRKKKKKTEGNFAAITREKRSIQAEIDGLNAAIQSGTDRMNEMESELVEVQKNLYGLDLERTAGDNQKRILKERLGEVNEAISAGKAREDAVRAKLSKLETEKDSTRETHLQLTRQIEEITANAENFQRDIARFDENRSNNQERIEENNGNVKSLEAKLEDMRSKHRKITDDIVTQLDQRLKESGYSYSDRQRMEKEIEETLQLLRIHLEGKQAIVLDMEQIPWQKKEHIEKLIGQIKELIDVSLNRIETLGKTMEDYKNTTPSFLDDFLSPKGVITQKRGLDDSIGENQEQIQKLRQENEDLLVENRRLAEKSDTYKKTLEELRVASAKMETQRSTLDRELKRFNDELSEQETALQSTSRETDENTKRIQAIEKQLHRLDLESSDFESKGKKLHLSRGKLERGIAELNDRLALDEEQLKIRTMEVAGLREQEEQVNIQLAETKRDIRHIFDGFKERHSRDLSEYENNLAEITESRGQIRQKLAATREEIRQMGQVNLMAPEEFSEVRERYEFLSGQIEDLQKAHSDLKRISEEIQTACLDRYHSMYNKIKKNFRLVFRKLFGGGKAELSLLNPEDTLNSGIDIVVQPPGKKLESIALLSGGERSLTAAALIFAIYMAKPSPFCFLDEIDAALDEENIRRFAEMLREFSENCQFVIISHNKRTISIADTLLGITMEETGVSKLISARLRN